MYEMVNIIINLGRNLRLKEFASRTKEYFVAECTKDIIQEIFWSKLNLT